MIDKNIVWNKFIRITHWLVAVIIILDMFFITDGSDGHRWIGYIAFGAVMFRLVYGFSSQNQAHSFSNFPLSPASLFQFMKNKFKGHDQTYKGHNPAASLTYILIWVCVLGLAITGWMLGLDRFFGDEQVEQTHVVLNTVLQITIVIHLLGIILDSIQFKRPTWMSMINGQK